MLFYHFKYGKIISSRKVRSLCFWPFYFFKKGAEKMNSQTLINLEQEVMEIFKKYVQADMIANEENISEEIIYFPSQDMEDTDDLDDLEVFFDFDDDATIIDD